MQPHKHSLPWSQIAGQPIHSRWAWLVLSKLTFQWSESMLALLWIYWWSSFIPLILHPSQSRKQTKAHRLCFVLVSWIGVCTPFAIQSPRTWLIWIRCVLTSAQSLLFSLVHLAEIRNQKVAIKKLFAVADFVTEMQAMKNLQSPHLVWYSRLLQMLRLAIIAGEVTGMVLQWGWNGIPNRNGIHGGRRSEQIDWQSSNWIASFHCLQIGLRYHERVILSSSEGLHPSRSQTFQHPLGSQHGWFRIA